MSEEQYQVVLRPEPGHWRADGFRRFKAALKTLLRAYGLRAIDIRIIKPNENAKRTEPTDSSTERKPH